ncbi:unnamed protein product, partial [marine sediment metagenome]
KDGNIQQKFRLGWVCYYSRAHGRNKENQEWFYFDNINSFWEFVFDRMAKNYAAGMRRIVCP